MNKIKINYIYGWAIGKGFNEFFKVVEIEKGEVLYEYEHGKQFKASLELFSNYLKNGIIKEIGKLGILLYF